MDGRHLESGNGLHAGLGGLQKLLRTVHDDAICGTKGMAGDGEHGDAVPGAADAAVALEKTAPDFREFDERSVSRRCAIWVY